MTIEEPFVVTDIPLSSWLFREGGRIRMRTKRLVACVLFSLTCIALAPVPVQAGVDVTIEVADREARPARGPVMPKTGTDSLPVIAAACAIAALGAAMLRGPKRAHRGDLGGDR